MLFQRLPAEVAVFPLLPVISSSKAPCKVTVFPPGLCIPQEAVGDGQDSSEVLKPSPLKAEFMILLPV